MKYLVKRVGGCEVAFLFPAEVQHREMVPVGREHEVISAAHFEVLLGDDERPRHFTASAHGEPRLQVHVFGNSKFLDKEPREHDARLILAQLLRRES